MKTGFAGVFAPAGGGSRPKGGNSQALQCVELGAPTGVSPRMGATDETCSLPTVEAMGMNWVVPTGLNSFLGVSLPTVKTVGY